MTSPFEATSSESTLATHYEAMRNAVDVAVRSLGELFNLPEYKAKDEIDGLLQDSIAGMENNPGSHLDWKSYGPILEALCSLDLKFRKAFDSDTSFMARLADTAEPSFTTRWKRFDDAHAAIQFQSTRFRDAGVDMALRDVHIAARALGAAADKLALLAKRGSSASFQPGPADGWFASTIPALEEGDDIESAGSFQPELKAWLDACITASRALIPDGSQSQGDLETRGASLRADTTTLDSVNTLLAMLEDGVQVQIPEVPTGRTKARFRSRLCGIVRRWKNSITGGNTGSGEESSASRPTRSIASMSETERQSLAQDLRTIKDSLTQLSSQVPSA
jgi:hypothetical protein